MWNFVAIQELPNFCIRPIADWANIITLVLLLSKHRPPRTTARRFGPANTDYCNVITFGLAMLAFATPAKPTVRQSSMRNLIYQRHFISSAKCHFGVMLENERYQLRRLKTDYGILSGKRNASKLCKVIATLAIFATAKSYKNVLASAKCPYALNSSFNLVSPRQQIPVVKTHFAPPSFASIFPHSSARWKRLASRMTIGSLQNATTSASSLTD